jgi:hypothetical protein
MQRWADRRPGGVVVSVRRIMALSEQHYEAINKELQRIRERLLALADQIATATAPESDYRVAYEALGFASKHIAHVQHLMEMARQLDEMKRAST